MTTEIYVEVSFDAEVVRVAVRDQLRTTAAWSAERIAVVTP